MVLNNGVSAEGTGKQVIRFETGDPRDFRTFDDF